MKSKAVGSVLAAALAAVSFSSLAAEVTLTGWAFGSGNNVQASGAGITAGSYSGAAGGFRGTLSGAGVFNTSSFLTYCIELEETFSFSAAAMSGYTVVDATTYFEQRRALDGNRPLGAQVAERLGQLMSWAGADPTRVDSAAESSALQLAVWNIVYDNDWSLTPAGRFNDLSAFSAGASQMLSASSQVTNRYDVFALTRAGKQDFLLTSLRVPEPGSLALAAAALLGLSLTRRRRA